MDLNSSTLLALAIGLASIGTLSLLFGNRLFRLFSVLFGAFLGLIILGVPTIIFEEAINFKVIAMSLLGSILMIWSMLSWPRVSQAWLGICLVIVFLVPMNFILSGTMHTTWLTIIALILALTGALLPKLYPILISTGMGSFLITLAGLFWFYSPNTLMRVWSQPGFQDEFAIREGDVLVGSWFALLIFGIFFQHSPWRLKRYLAKRKIEKRRREQVKNERAEEKK